MENNLIWLCKLLLALFTSDFFLQKSSWIEDRNRYKVKSRFLYVHILITGITALLLIGPKYWKTVLVVTATHYLIDLGKSYLLQNFRTFLLDQMSHIAVILACWLSVAGLVPSWEAIADFYNNDSFWIVAACVVFLTYPAGFIIARATKPWSDQVVASEGRAGTGLISAGKYIGITERLIICLLVCLGQYEAIGLLITGKSILRYNSSNEEIKTEYLLVGTLISIFIAFAVGLLLKWLLGV